MENNEDLLRAILKALNDNNKILKDIFSLFSKYDDSYSEEVIKENGFNI